LNNYLGPVAEAVEDKLTRTLRRLDEAIEIISDVLKISKLKLLENLHKEPVEITDLVNKAIEQKTALIQSKKITVAVNDHRKTKYNVDADEVLIDLAFSNLLGNAVKYTHEGGRIHFDITEDGTNKLILEILDDGVGIPEKELPKLFKQFFRTSNIKHKGYEGTGLGLSIVKEILEQHGWQITVESPSKLSDEIGPGTSFKIMIN
jgi:two-component system phosphate regulon sensor histidine kinase PhoR